MSNSAFPQDIYNTDEVLSQILKSSVKMDGLLDKLSKLETSEAAEKLIWPSIQQHFYMRSRTIWFIFCKLWFMGRVIFR